MSKPSIGIFVTVGNEKQDPFERGDCFLEALESYRELADMVVVVDGSGRLKMKPSGSLQIVSYMWPWNFDWVEIPKHMNCGLEALDTDIRIRCDSDYVFHDLDISEIRNGLFDMYDKGYEVVTMQKFSFVLRDRYYEKGKLPIVVNAGLLGDKKIRLGIDRNQKTDLCYPVVVEGVGDGGLYYGSSKSIKFGYSPFAVYNYDYSFKTKEQTIDEFWRFSEAYHSYYGEWTFGATKEDAFNVFLGMMGGRLRKCVYRMGENGHRHRHPKYIEGRIKGLTEKEFSYNGWGLL